jgi:hypothetical protein
MTFRPPGVIGTLIVLWVLFVGIWSVTFAREYSSVGVLGIAFLPAFLVGPALVQVILSRIRVATRSRTRWRNSVG